jgi:signal transduction histidine kinase
VRPIRARPARERGRTAWSAVTGLLRTASFRLAAFYALLFGASAVALFGVVYWIASQALHQQLTASIENEMAILSDAHRAGGAEQIAATIRARLSSGRHPARYYVLQDAAGRELAGNLTVPDRRQGFIELPIPAGEHQEDDPPDEGSGRTLLALGRILPDGRYLVVGQDRQGIREAKEAIVTAFGWGLGVTLLLAAVGGALASAGFLRRVDAINRTTRGIIQGNLADRVPTRGTGDELDRLAANLNEMLDRTQSLMGALRRVSSDIAHDLRTPLTRLRQRLEAARANARTAEEAGAAIDRAIGDVDELLMIFSALLRIAQIESGSRRAGFAPLDLSAVFRKIADAYAPVAEDQGQSLTSSIGAQAPYRGDRQLLEQMLANLVENALRHTPRGSTISLSLHDTPDGLLGSVADTGPGIPVDARAKVFQPFYRLETSRSTPGSGLGLALVAAIADLHRIRVELSSNEPGLKVSLGFGRGADAAERHHAGAAES